MLIGSNFFNGDNCSMLENDFYFSSYRSMNIRSGLIDHLYIEEGCDVDSSSTVSSEWGYQTVLNAGFDNSIEAGSIIANNIPIEKIKFQKREPNKLAWTDIALLKYNIDDKLFYEVFDRNVANGFTYEYSIIPVTSSIYGQRVVTGKIDVNFEGIFLSDKDFNYGLFNNLELGDIVSNVKNAIFEPLNSKFPIVVHSNLDYSTFSVGALFLSEKVLNDSGGEIDVKAERVKKDNFMGFIKNGKPKLYRDQNGILKLVSLMGKPVETPWVKKNLSVISFELIEIGDVDGDTLSANNILQWE